MNDYQVFISYRRDGGDALAGRLSDRLSALGYKVFYDVESMRSGAFNTQLLEAINLCNDVLLILPPNGLDRCVNEDDWVRQEITFAIKEEKNIIPVLMRGFEFPAHLPADIDEVRYMEGVEASTVYFDAVIDRIVGLLKTQKPQKKRETPIVIDDYSKDKEKLPFKLEADGIRFVLENPNKVVNGERFKLLCLNEEGYHIDIEDKDLMIQVIKTFERKVKLSTTVEKRKSLMEFLQKQHEKYSE